MTSLSHLMNKDSIGGGGGGIESILNCSLLSCCVLDMDANGSGPLCFLPYGCSTSLSDCKLVVVSHFALWCSSLSQGIQSETERCIIIESIYCTNPKAVRRISEESILPGK